MTGSDFIAIAAFVVSAAAAVLTIRLQRRQVTFDVQSRLDETIVHLMQTQVDFPAGVDAAAFNQNANLTLQATHLAWEADALRGQGGELPFTGCTALGWAFSNAWEMEKAEEYNTLAVASANTSASKIYTARSLAQFLFARGGEDNIRRGREAYDSVIGLDEIVAVGADYAHQIDSLTFMLWRGSELLVPDEQAASRLLDRARSAAAAIGQTSWRRTVAGNYIRAFSMPPVPGPPLPLGSESIRADDSLSRPSE